MNHSILQEIGNRVCETEVIRRGELFSPWGIDYFVFPHHLYTEMPDFTIGRVAWDNWMIYCAHTTFGMAIDASMDVLAVHQNHDYNHLPEKTLYGTEIARSNLAKAGGRKCIFNTLDTNRELFRGQRPHTTNCGLCASSEIGTGVYKQRRKRLGLGTVPSTTTYAAIARRDPEEIIMRVGQNPARFVEKVAQPAEITVAVVNCIPFLSGYYEQSLEVLKVVVDSLNATRESSSSL